MVMDPKYKLQPNVMPDYGGANSGLAAAARQNLNLVEQLQEKNEQMYESMAIACDQRNEYKAMNAGLRAVVRALLAQIRELDPNNKLLNKKNREWVYRQFEMAELERMNQSRAAAGQPLMKPRLNEEEKHGF